MIGLGTQLRLLTDALDGSVDAIYRECGLPFRARYYPYFRLLDEHGDLAVGELAVLLGFTQPAVTQTLARMRDEGLIAPARSNDRRERRYRLTDGTRAMLPELRRVWTATERAASRLDEALAAPLGEIIQGALRQLSQTPFSQMIEEELLCAENDDRPDPAGLGGERVGQSADRPQ